MNYSEVMGACYDYQSWARASFVSCLLPQHRVLLLVDNTELDSKPALTVKWI